MEVKQVEMTANAGKEKERKLVIDLPTPTDLEEAKTMFGEKVVFDVFVAQYIIKAQAAGRGQLALEDKETGLSVKTDAEVIEYMKNWKLTGGNRSKLSLQEKLKRAAGKGMSKADLLALIQEMDDEEFEDVEDADDVESAEVEDSEE